MYQFLYRTNEMCEEQLVEYMTKLLNADPKLSEDDKKKTKTSVIAMTKYLYNEDGKGEMWNRINPPDYDEFYSEKKNIHEAIDDFFEQDFVHDLWDLDPEVKIGDENINIEKIVGDRWAF